MAHMIAMAKFALVHIHMPAVAGYPLGAIQLPDRHPALFRRQIAPLGAAGLPAHAPLAGHYAPPFPLLALASCAFAAARMLAVVSPPGCSKAG